MKKRLQIFSNTELNLKICSRLWTKFHQIWFHCHAKKDVGGQDVTHYFLITLASLKT